MLVKEHKYFEPISLGRFMEYSLEGSKLVQLQLNLYGGFLAMWLFVCDLPLRYLCIFVVCGELLTKVWAVYY